MRQNTKKPSILRLIKRAILWTSGILALVAVWVAYSNITPATHSRAGRAAVWSAGMVIAPAIDAVPVWVWGLVAGAAVYLWLKHKLMMSIVYGVALGLVLAVI